MGVTVLCGMQWGDEGKGKLVDVLAKDVQYVVRFQGGNNAGHTIVVNGKKYVFHLLPSGVIHTQARCLLATGMLVDPKVLLEEIQALEAAGISSENIFISNRAQLIMPYHVVLDGLQEEQLQSRKIGTTRRGIGPAYMDKYERSGIRAGDLLHKEHLKELIFNNVAIKNKLIQHVYGGQPLDAQKIYQDYLVYAEQLGPRIVDTTEILHKATRKGENILCEGAQATMLDIDHGNYPFVTSSSPSVAAASVGAGIGPGHITRRVGVFKAYCTRVGTGPFPTELNNEVGETIRTLGHEFGATTGRPRRTGWLDLVALKYSVELNDFTEVAMMKLDILSNFSRIFVATGYTYQGRAIDYVPADAEEYGQVQPMYQEFEGWNVCISNITKFEDLPKQAQKYIIFVEQNLGVPIKMVSVGPDRTQLLERL